MFFIIRKTEEIDFNYSQNSISIIENGNTKNHKFVKWFKQWIIKVWCKKQFVIDVKKSIDK